MSAFRELTESEREIAAALNESVLVDRSELGKLRITGADRSDLLHRLSTNDLLKHGPSSSTGTILTTDKGRIVDYVRVLTCPDSLLLITSHGQSTKIRSWIDKFTIMEDIHIMDVTHDEPLLVLVGSKSFQSMSKVLGEAPRPNEHLSYNLGEFTLRVDHQKEFGTDLFNIFFESGSGADVVERLTERAAEHGVARVSGSVYDYFRVFHGIPGGRELTDSFNPYEVNLRHAISFTKGCYIGQEVIARLETYQKIRRGLVLLSFPEDLPNEIENNPPVIKKGLEIGVLTSISKLPFEGKRLALGVIRRDEITIGEVVEVVVQDIRTEGYISKIF